MTAQLLRFSFILLFVLVCTFIEAEPLRYKGTSNLPGNGKHVVLVSGDEEYRSE
jgi:hypothetical protein